MWVVDASVAVKWFFEHEEGTLQAESVLDSIVQASDHFFVPDLFFTEFSAVMMKKSKDKNFSISALQKVQQLGLKSIPSGREILEKAIILAGDEKLSVYDGVYVATAILLGAVWITADKKASKGLKKNIALDLIDYAPTAD